MGAWLLAGRRLRREQFQPSKVVRKPRHGMDGRRVGPPTPVRSAQVEEHVRASRADVYLSPTTRHRLGAPTQQLFCFSLTFLRVFIIDSLSRPLLVLCKYIPLHATNRQGAQPYLLSHLQTYTQDNSSTAAHSQADGLSQRLLRRARLRRPNSPAADRMATLCSARVRSALAVWLSDDIVCAMPWMVGP